MQEGIVGPPSELGGRSAHEETVRQLQAYEAALKDIVALANGDGEIRQRLIQMQRRAIAALSGIRAPRDAIRDYAALHPVAVETVVRGAKSGAGSRGS